MDEYATLALEAGRIKDRMEWLKGYFETMATNDLKDTKLLTASLLGKPEQPGDGDQRRLGEAGVADHGEAAAGQHCRGLHQNGDHRHDDRPL